MYVACMDVCESVSYVCVCVRVRVVFMSLLTKSSVPAGNIHAHDQQAQRYTDTQDLERGKEEEEKEEEKEKKEMSGRRTNDRHSCTRYLLLKKFWRKREIVTLLECILVNALRQ